MSGHPQPWASIAAPPLRRPSRFEAWAWRGVEWFFDFIALVSAVCAVALVLVLCIWMGA